MRTCACCSGRKVRRGLWSPDEDKKLKDYVQMHGCKAWNQVPLLAGLERCGKSCRLRWINYLRPGIKRGQFSSQEQQLIFDLQAVYGNRWAWIAKWIPGRTDNEIKNFWKVHKKIKNGPVEFDRVSKYRLAMPLWIDICEPRLEEGGLNKCEVAAVEVEAEAENPGINSTYCMEKSSLDNLDDVMSDMCWFDEELQEFMIQGRL